jgi:2-isopropylmalate synthase
MYSHGVDPKLDFSNMPAIVEVFERVTRMQVHQRSPYGGELVFAAFSGSHQDAIAKGMNYRADRKEHRWTVPYIVIDPHDIGRTYDADIIRINSQSGKGGIGYVLEQNYGYVLPPKMREALGYAVKDVSDSFHKELKPEEVFKVFADKYLNITEPMTLSRVHFIQEDNDMITASAKMFFEGSEFRVVGEGNGRLDAVANAIRDFTGSHFVLETYSEHALEHESSSRAGSYVGLRWADGSISWGVGTDTDIIRAGIKALISAFNNGYDKEDK